MYKSIPNNKVTLYVVRSKPDLTVTKYKQLTFLNDMKLINQVDYDNLFISVTSIISLIECKANNFHFFAMRCQNGMHAIIIL